MNIDLNLPKKLQPLFKPKRFKVLYGGRGSAKSWGAAQALEIIGLEKKTRVLCTREFQGSIKESVHKLLSNTVSRLQLDNFYEIQQANITGRNGTEFIFEGLKNNTTKIKSMEGVDIVWCEEAENISETSWDLLIPTIRKDGSEIWVVFNPHDEMDATYQKFVKPYLEAIERDGFYEDDEIVVVQMNYRDNPWFPDELRKEMEKCKTDNYQKYLHIWEGQCNADYADSIIQPEWVDAAIDAHLKMKGFDRGVKCLAFDPADEGDDNKAVAVRHGTFVNYVDQWGDGDVGDATDKAFGIADDYRCSELVYDSVGVGAAVKVGLKERIATQQIRVTGFGGGDAVDYPDVKYQDDRLNEDVFRNKRAQYWWLLRDRFEATYRFVVKNEYSDPVDMISLNSDIEHITQLKSELVRVQRKRGSNTLIQLESKPEMKRRGAKSPNMADALVMAFANPPVKAVTSKYDDWNNPIN